MASTGSCRAAGRGRSASRSGHVAPAGSGLAPWPGRSRAMTARPASARRSSQPGLAPRGGGGGGEAVDEERRAVRARRGRLRGWEDGLRVNRSVVDPRSTSSRCAPARRAGPAASTPTGPTPGSSVRFDVESSPSLGPRQRARVLDRLGPVVRVVADDERSQARNRALARRAARGPAGERRCTSTRPRRPTTPTQGSVERRLEAKRRQAERKRRALAHRRGLSASGAGSAGVARGQGGGGVPPTARR